MGSNRGWMFLTAAFLALIILISIAFLGWLLLNQQQDVARKEFLPPVVQVVEPRDGIHVQVGSHLPVSVNIFFTPEAPLQRVEVWLDGVLVENHDTASDGELSSFLDTLLLIPTEGRHVLAVRAINSMGVIGQSEPLAILGVSRQKNDLIRVLVDEGDDLADLAATFGTDEATIKSLNPELGDQPPMSGAKVIVPIQAEEENLPSQPTLPVPAGGSFPSINPATLPLDPAGLPGWNLQIMEFKPPDAPDSLQAQAKDCKITLVWNDIAKNESGYNIWMKGPNSPAHIIAVLEPSSGGQTWFEFSAPINGSLMFWVAAFNIIGAQESNIAIAEVETKCAVSMPTHLQVELLDLSVGANYNQAYCYLSLEDSLEARIPEQDGDFIPIQSGIANISALPTTYSVPNPIDSSLEASGECWAWAGGSLVKMGIFKGSFSKQTWNGSRQEIDGGVFKIGLSISAQGSAKLSGALTYDKFPDPLLPPPYNVLEQGTRCPGASCSGVYLTWDWQPDSPSKTLITGFDIYLNGNLYKSVTDPQARSTPVVPPAGCGKQIRWQVASVAATTRSMLSLPFEYGLPPCQAYAVVKFETLDIPWTGDGIYDGPCDELDLYYSLTVQGNYGRQQKIYGYGGESSYPTIFNAIGKGFILGLKPITCTKDTPPYTFAELGSWFSIPYPDTLIVPISDTNIIINIMTYFYDYDSYGGNDLFGMRLLSHTYPDLQNAVHELGCGGKKFRDPWDGYQVEDTADTSIRYTIIVYPNSCNDVPPGIPLPVK